MAVNDAILNDAGLPKNICYKNPKVHKHFSVESCPFLATSYTKNNKHSSTCSPIVLSLPQFASFSYLLAYISFYASKALTIFH